MNKFVMLSTLVALVSAVSKDDCHNAGKCLLEVEDQNISECMDVSSVKTVNCATYSCNDQLSVKIIEMKCKYDGQCVSDGVEQKSTTCTTYRCETSSNVVGDVTHYKSSMVIIDIECTDVNGDCHADQEILPYKIGDKIYNCKCNIDFENNSIRYTGCMAMP